MKEIALDGSGNVEAFHASFIQHSGGAAAALTGSVWFQAVNAITSRITSFGREGEPFSYQIIANVEPSSYSATSLPAGLSVDAPSGLITGTPTQSGVFQVTLGANGPSRQASDVLSLVIHPSQALVNVSTRMKVRTGDDVMIGGFISAGAEPKRVIVRAIGPSLSEAGVPSPSADPNLELFRAGVPIGQNDDWRTTQMGGSITANQRPDLEASGIPPANDLESAIILTLEPGSYTAVVRGFGSTTGVGLVEVYDVGQNSNSRLANISTRGFVETADNAMIGGFIMGGKPGSGGRVVVRALGPSLAESGVSNVLADPTLQLFDQNGTLLRANNNWKDSQEADIEALNLAPSKPAEAALVMSLPLGGFTAVVRGVGNTVGNALVEVYNVP